ncbi:hypothetical protein [Halobellus marinus]|uniref:hypothetical protein n=1 Tax=Halobellus sp. GCM10025813 TaxID=3252665 RepID=UPI0036211415
MSTQTPPPALRQLDDEEFSARIVRQKIWKPTNLQNQHFMGAIVGREGTGKSHSALTIASAVDPEFSADDVFFKPEKLLEALRSDEYGAGNAVVVDEAGVGLGNRSWYEKEQILLNQALQTARDDNAVVLFTLPRLEELDSQTIGRLHAFIEMMDVHPAEGWASAKWKNINLSRDGRGKTYKKYPRMRINGVEKRITRFAISAPDDDLVDAYEERKEAFKDELYEEAIAAYDDDEGDDGKTPDEIADEIIDEGVSKYVSEHNGNGRLYVDKDMIRVKYDISHHDATAVKKFVEQSVDLEQFGSQTHT